MGKKLGLYEIPDDPSLEVTTYNILKLTRFDEDGLYSERIFGPVHDYVCRCGIYSETGEGRQIILARTRRPMELIHYICR